MTGVLIGVAALLAAVAAAGILHPFRGPGARTAQPLVDPLDDERAGLLRALRELDGERATGQLPEPEYVALRAETERRAVAVLRAMEARDGAGDLAAGLRELRPETPARGNGAADRPGRARGLPVALAGVAVAAVAVPLLLGAIRSRTADQPVTGDTQTSPISFFQDRVRDHPNDVAARLDLAAAYLGQNDLPGAVEQYLAALQLSPRNPEARATLGFLLYRAGKPEEGLRAEDLALEVAPAFPLALYYKGVILLEGLDRPADAAQTLRAYLAASTFDLASRRQDARKLLSEAESRSSGP